MKKTKSIVGYTVFFFLAAGVLLLVFLYKTSSLQEKAQKEYTEKQYAKASQLLEQAQIEAPENSAVAFNLGVAHYRAGKFEEAKKSFVNAVRNGEFDEKKNANCYANAGNCDFSSAIGVTQPENWIDNKEIISKAIQFLEGALLWYQSALDCDANDQTATTNKKKAEELLAFLRKRLKDLAEQTKENQDGKQGQKDPNNSNNRKNDQSESSEQQQSNGQSQQSNSEQQNNSEVDEQQSKNESGGESKSNDKQSGREKKSEQSKSGMENRQKRDQSQEPQNESPEKGGSSPEDGTSQDESMGEQSKGEQSKPQMGDSQQPKSPQDRSSKQQQSMEQSNEQMEQLPSGEKLEQQSQPKPKPQTMGESSDKPGMDEQSTGSSMEKEKLPPEQRRDESTMERKADTSNSLAEQSPEMESEQQDGGVEQGAGSEHELEKQPTTPKGVSSKNDSVSEEELETRKTLPRQQTNNESSRALESEGHAIQEEAAQEDVARGRQRKTLKERSLEGLVKTLSYKDAALGVAKTKDRLGSGEFNKGW